MSEILVPLSFKTRRSPYPSKVKSDGERMYNHARYIIILDEKGAVVESFENPPFATLVDCLVVLAPCLCRGEYVERAVALELGFRRFVPYSQTEVRPNGRPKFIPRIRGSYKVPVNKPRAQRPKTFCLEARTPVIKLSEETLLAILPEIARGVQKCVHRIIGYGNSLSLIQERVVLKSKLERAVLKGKPDRVYTYAASIFVRIPAEEKLLCATACFAESFFRDSPNGPIVGNAERLSSLCSLFFVYNRHSKTSDGNYMDECVKGSNIAFLISDYLKIRIETYRYSEQMVDQLLAKIDKPTSKKRKLIDQVMRLYKIAKPKRDPLLDELERKYGSMKKKILAKWGLDTFRSLRHDRKRTRHARNSITFSVIGSHEELRKMKDVIVVRMREKSLPKPTTLEEDMDADIPF